ncbi:MAG TPA: carboxyl transferase domain-containing protein, partial [Pseudomonadales bacterium]
MDKQLQEGDRLYLIAESLAQDFSLFPRTDSDELLPGCLGKREILRRAEHLSRLDVDSYIEAVVAAAEDPGRTPAPVIIRELGRVLEEQEDGSYYSAVVEMDFGGDTREVGFIAQDRSHRNGEWGPQHHLRAADRLRQFSRRSIPIVTLMDTPGADAKEEANRNHQAHSISRLIAEASNVDVPNVGIVYGLGYSGGAIPLAASNMILALRDSVFSTIQPKSLASIARRLNLSWQECAKYVGLGAYELYRQGNIDGVIDYSPVDPDPEKLRMAIVAGISRVEETCEEFVARNPYILDHYRQSLQRFLNPSENLKRMQASAALKLSRNPTEYLNVFGVAFRYLRYLKVRQRIKATNTSQYGRLSNQELPEGELDKRAELERRLTFLKWLQDPDRVVYDDALSRAWKNYNEKKQAVHDERGRIAQLLFGEPKKNYEEARAGLLSAVGVFLYNRWKTEAVGNLRALKVYLGQPEDIRQILQLGDIADPRELLAAVRTSRLRARLRASFSHEGRKLISEEQDTREKSDQYLRTQLTVELNLAITGSSLDDGESASLKQNRAILAQSFSGLIKPAATARPVVAFSDMTVLDVLMEDDLRSDFIKECENLLLFDSVYDQIIANLDEIAEEAQATQALSKKSLAQLVQTTLSFAVDGLVLGASEAAEDKTDRRRADLGEQMTRWYLRIRRLPKNTEFFRSVEEWKKVAFPHLSDALFVVVTYLFEDLLLSYFQSERDGGRFQGRIAPKNIGRRKDFWNRLDMAYRDLRINNVLRDTKNQKKTGYRQFIDRFVSNFEERYADLLSSDPRRFPGFRLSIEQALARGQEPCGIVAGFGDFKVGPRTIRAG